MEKANSGEYLKSYYPFTGKEALIPRCNETDAHLAVSAAKQAMEADEWRSLNATQRGHLLRRLGDIIENMQSARAKSKSRIMEN